VAQYFLLLDAGEFHAQLRPPLAASWRSRSFAPCHALCQNLLPRAREFATRYHLSAEEPLLSRVAGGLPFDRTLWQHVVGEVLWFGAAEIPEIQTAEQALTCLLAPGGAPPDISERPAWTPIRQAHNGSRDLVFGGGYYRPDHAGWNDLDDVQRLATYLKAVDPVRWRSADLLAWSDLPAEDREDELAFARDWFSALVDLYHQAAEAHQVVVCESL
jgi:hypothetical protein